ncbi:zinc finger protein with KRAB and SCAN domains 7-like isoform X3 [Aricia agestis]|uniref:zinc finger protein with KRAB and SCAN domains 7-like isoform X3 n=1 Tax=Aricia agestis TaxID=91739 RepID=UPI001C20A3F6|nr:zinc finger protein with KRAB and SCAN domains 7-like isoform X3 [Aricia agestis]
MDSDTWKIENSICRCCHAEGYFFNLGEPRPFCGQTEVYADMIRDIFDIDMRPLPGPLCDLTYTICMSCIFKLREAIQFKKQVQSCEDKFLDYYYTNKLEVKKKDVAQAVIKIEPVVEFKEEYLNEDEFDSNDDTNQDFAMHDDNDDDDEDDDDDEGSKLEYLLKKGKGKGKGKSEPVQVVIKAESAPVKPEQRTTNKKLVKVNKITVPVKKKDEKKKFRLREEDYERSDDNFKCLKCDKVYNKLHSLREHLKTKHYDMVKLHECNICQRAFSTDVQFIVHKYEEHNIDDRFKCNACTMVFNTKRQLIKHRNGFHMLGEKFKCNSCDYVCYHVQALRRHKVKHKTAKDHHCKFCRKSFLRRSTLRYHERIHTGDKRKICNECGEAFVQKASLNYHMTKHHPEVKF